MSTHMEIHSQLQRGDERSGGERQVGEVGHESVDGQQQGCVGPCQQRILDHRVLELPTKRLRMRSLLWVRPSFSAEHLSNASVVAQLLPTLLLNLAALSSGLSLGFSSVVMPMLRPDVLEGNATWPLAVDDEEATWIAGSFGLGGVVGGLVSGLLASLLGCRKVVLMLAFTHLMGWSVIFAARSSIMLIVGRLLTGVAAVGFLPIIQVYVAEIAQPKHRGWLAAITLPSMALGSLMSQVLGSLLSWHWLALSGCLLPLVMTPLVWGLLPESPLWYLMQGEEKKAVQVMERLRASDANALAELLALAESLGVANEEEKEERRAKITWKLFLDRMMWRRQYRRPFLILVSLFLMANLSGSAAVNYYAIKVFQEASSSGVGSSTAALMAALIRLSGALLLVPATRSVSRKTLLCFSALGMGVAQLLLGLSVYAPEPSGLPRMPGLLALVCVVVFIVADVLGLGSMPLVLTSEFYPSPMRSLLAGLTLGLSHLEHFLVAKTFPSMSVSMGDHGTFWMYAGVCFVAIVFVLLFVPESKDKSLHQIEQMFAYKPNLHVTPLTTPALGRRRGTAGASVQFTL